MIQFQEREQKVPIWNDSRKNKFQFGKRITTKWKVCNKEMPKLMTGLNRWEFEKNIGKRPV